MPRTWLIWIAIAITFSVWFITFRPGILAGPAGYILVTGESMETTFYAGDLVITRKQSHYALGDVVAFRTDQGIVIHRIIGGSSDAGYVTQGDNRENPDSWRPKPEHIIGKQWLHLPEVGNWAFRLRQPKVMGALFGLLAAISVPIKKKAGRRQRQRRRRSMDAPSANNRFGMPDGPANMLVALALAAVLAIGFLTATVYTFRQATSTSEFVERLSYEHAANFGYTVHTDQSTLYPDGSVGPVTAGAEGIASDQAAPVYTQLANSIDVAVIYALQSANASDFTGEMSVNLEVGAPDGWTKAFELLPPTPFEGTGTSAEVSIDLSKVQSLIEAVEEETGFSPGTYELRVMPNISVEGVIGEETIASTYVPPLVFSYSRTEITPDAELSRTETEQVGATIERANMVSPLGQGLSISTARMLSVAGLMLSLTGTGLLAGVVFLGLGRSEAEKIRARYGSMLIEVTEADLAGWGATVEVASISDLARLARRDGNIIFHRELGQGTRRYFVPDGPTTYQYTVEAPHRGQWSPQPAVAEGD